MFSISIFYCDILALRNFMGNGIAASPTSTGSDVCTLAPQSKRIAVKGVCEPA